MELNPVEVGLYLALRDVVSKSPPTAMALNKARGQLAQFELNLGPLPNWAEDFNLTYDLKVGTQLLTKDGRRVGNAWIWKTEPGDVHELFKIVTDAGANMTLTGVEVHELFYIGVYLCTIERIVQFCDRAKV